MIGEFIKNHKLIRAISRIRDKTFPTKSNDYKEGFDDCLRILIFHFNNLPHNLIQKNIELKKQISTLQDKVKTLSSDRVNYEDVKRYRHELSLSILGVLSKGKVDEAIKVLNKWNYKNNNNEL